MADIAEEEMAHQPSAGVNPPAWILGHLAVVNDMALGMLGQPTLLPESWAGEFGPGSQPLPQNGAYPSKQELLDALQKGYAALAEVAANVDLDQLSGPHPIAPLLESLPTQGDLLAHVLTTHPAMHLGHLSNWRRQMGRPPLF